MLLDLTDGSVQIVLLCVVPLCDLVGGSHIPGEHAASIFHGSRLCFKFAAGLSKVIV